MQGMPHIEEAKEAPWMDVSAGSREESRALSVV